MTLFSSSEVAVLLGVSMPHVGRLARTGRLRHFRDRGHLSFSLDDVEAFRKARALRKHLGGRPTTIETMKKRLTVAEGPPTDQRGSDAPFKRRRPIAKALIEREELVNGLLAMDHDAQQVYRDHRGHDEEEGI